MSTGTRREDCPVFDRDHPPTAESRPTCCVCRGTTFRTDQAVKANMFSPVEEPALFVDTSAADLHGHRDPIAYVMEGVLCRRCWNAKEQPKAYALSDVLSDLGVTGLRRFTALREKAPEPARREAPSAPAPPKPASPLSASRGRPKAPAPSRVEQFARRYQGVIAPARAICAVTAASAGPSGSQLGSDSGERWTLAEHPELQGLQAYLHDKEEREQTLLESGGATILPDGTVVPHVRHPRPRPVSSYCIVQKDAMFSDGKRCYPKRGVEVVRFGEAEGEMPEGVEPIEHESSGASTVGSAPVSAPAAAVQSAPFDDTDRFICFVETLRRFSAHRDELAGKPVEFQPLEVVIAVLDRKFGFDHLVAAWNLVLDHHAAEPKIVRWPMSRAKKAAAQPEAPAEEAAPSIDAAPPPES